MINLAQLTAMFGEEPAEQQAVLAWTGRRGDPLWTEEEAAELLKIWNDTKGMPWEQPSTDVSDESPQLTQDECSAIGLDGTGRDGDPRFPYTEEKLTAREAAKLRVYRISSASAGFTG